VIEVVDRTKQVKAGEGGSMDFDSTSKSERPSDTERKSQFRDGSAGAPGQMREAVREAVDSAQSSVAQARSELHELDQQARHLVRERPLAALLGAVLVGFFVGRIASRL
jgi:hypothetical protein